MSWHGLHINTTLLKSPRFYFKHFLIHNAQHELKINFVCFCQVVQLNTITHLIYIFVYVRIGAEEDENIYIYKFVSDKLQPKDAAIEMKPILNQLCVWTGKPVTYHEL